MDPSPQQIPDALRIVASLVTGLAALLPPLSKPDLSKIERWAVALSAATLVFLFWPVEFSVCRHAMGYIYAALGLLAWSFFAHLLDILIIRQFGHTQVHREDETVSSRMILGGPKLTPTAAAAWQAQNNTLTTQQIFETLNYDPLRMWERWPRTLLIVTHRTIALSRALAFLLTLVAALAWFYVHYRTNQLHRALTIEPSTPQIVLEGRNIDIRPTLHECNPEVAWEIEGLSTEKARGSLGEITKSGTFSAPLMIERPVDLYIKATPVQHPDEYQKVKIQLRPHPEYGEHYDAVATDDNNRQVSFTIEVIDQRYSWVIGKSVLNGEDGQAFAKRMAADGVFNGFQTIICIGAASREYVRKGDEDDRARNRAQVLGHWVRNALHPRDTDITALKIGRYVEETKLPSEQTARERQVVIVGVRGADEGANLLSALRKAFAQKRLEEPLLGMYLDKYPAANWELQSVKTDD
jgi:hypothetical protein